jgi:hypothetical protein
MLDGGRRGVASSVPTTEKAGRVRSAIFRAADEILRLKQGKSLTEWMRDHDDLPLRHMARQLWIDTGEAIDVSHETLRAWKNNDNDPAAA